jgi:hypothetical protein
VVGGQDARLKSPCDAARQACGAQGRDGHHDGSFDGRSTFPRRRRRVPDSRTRGLVRSVGCRGNATGAWPDEVNYILKSWWYVSGAVKPYSAKTIAEIADLSLWTDAIARQWIESDFDWLVLQRQPAGRATSWLIWAPDAPLITTALEKCFEREAAPVFADFDPPLSVELYKRVRRGKVCLGE